MKRLNKKQIICISLFAFSTILYLIMAIWLAHNFITVILPIAKLNPKSVMQSIIYNLLFQFTLMFYFICNTFFMYKFYKNIAYNGDTTPPEEEPPTKV